MSSIRASIELCEYIRFFFFKFFFWPTYYTARDPTETSNIK